MCLAVVRGLPTTGLSFGDVKRVELTPGIAIQATPNQMPYLRGHHDFHHAGSYKAVGETGNAASQFAAELAEIVV